MFTLDRLKVICHFRQLACVLHKGSVVSQTVEGCVDRPGPTVGTAFFLLSRLAMSVLTVANRFLRA
jgi:hypothetical protein